MSDTFYFELSESVDGAYDISVNTADGVPFSTHDARRAANVLQMIIAEEEIACPIYCSIEVYENSLTSVRWRGDEPKLNSFSDYRWIRRRMDEAIHGQFSRYPLLPRWVLDVNSFFLFIMTRLMQIYCAITDRREEAATTIQENVPVDLETSLLRDPQSSDNVVVAFPRRED